MTPAARPTVFVLDGDAGARATPVRLLRDAALNVRAHDCAADFLADLPAAGTGPACLLLDVHLPDISGLELQFVLGERGVDLPLVFLCSDATLPMAVRALKAGAADFLTRPAEAGVVTAAVLAALRGDGAARRRRDALRITRVRFDRLTEREREVMARVVEGDPNKRIADTLGLSEVTVKVHRRHVMEKMAARSVADLVRASDRLGETLAGLPDAGSNGACELPTGHPGMERDPCSTDPF